jgi:hypothetical protein
MPIDFTDMCEGLNASINWSNGNRDDEDQGDALFKEALDGVRAFCMPGGRVDEAQVAFVNANSDFDLKVTGQTLSIVLPDPSSGDEKEFRISPD